MITVNFSPEVDTEKTATILKEIAKDKMGGWLGLPRRVDMKEFVRIKEATKKINEESEYLVCIGIGGSYLGHRAMIEALRPKSETKIIYAGNSLSKRELKRALDKVGDHDFSVAKKIFENKKKHSSSEMEKLRNNPFKKLAERYFSFISAGVLH